MKINWITAFRRCGKSSFVRELFFNELEKQIIDIVNKSNGGKMSITLQELDAEVAKLEALKIDYTQKKEESNRADALVKEQTEKLLKMLEESGKKKYSVDGLGTIGITETWAVTTPKTPEEKKSFFNWLQNEYGDDGFYAYATINYQQLNSLYNKVSEEREAAGLDTHIEGISLPTLVKKLSFRKGK